ncbi:unnamed protein product [Diabrotica balteata]|uniref:Uncharacterized protein n=1 Tax=Diabrotica balteata TaxID=107213 RepID=A0A9N9ST81_DIABA|nr:unnamed protein product [Diabrotica balteata]
MKHEHLLRSKLNATNHRPRECVSESSFLSDNFCSIILGKPGTNLMKKKILAVGEADFNKILNNRDASLRQQQVLICDVEHVSDTKSSKPNDDLSPIKNKVIIEKNKKIKGIIDSSGVNNSNNYNQKTLNRGLKTKKERKHRDLVKDGSKFQNVNDMQNDTRKNDNNNNNKYSEIDRLKYTRIEESYEPLINDSHGHPNLVKPISGTETRDIESDLNVRNTLTSQMTRLNNSHAEVIVPDKIIHSKEQFGNNEILSDNDLNQYIDQDKSKKRSYENNLTEKTDIEKVRKEVTLLRSQPPLHDSLINTYEPVAYNVPPTFNSVDVEKEYQGQQIKTDSPYNQGLALTADSRPCYCDTNSQTSHPSILKPSQQRTLNSEVDKYPVKEARSMRSKIFANKLSQTSDSNVTRDNHMTGSPVGSHKMPLVDTSINTLEIESVGVQATGQDVTEISTTNSTESLTSEDIICYRPIHNFCGCHNRCCVKRGDIPVVPVPPPLEYDVSCSEDDLDLVIEEQSDQFFDSDDSERVLSRYNELPYQNSNHYINLVQELEEKLQSRNKSRVQRTLQEFERRSRLNKPLEKPVINYDETSESEEPLIKAISELAKKRNEDHKNFPCKGKACCTCILPAEKNEIEIKSNYSNNKPRIKTQSHWKQDGTNGAWYRTAKNLPKHVNTTSYSTNKFSHDCGCSCTCGKYP